MKYFVNSKEIIIDETKIPFGQGSEGKVYRQKDQLYKIYTNESLYEFGHNKFYHHQYLIGIPTKQINLPNALIFQEDGQYVGYRVPLVPGKQKLNLRTGFSQMSSNKLITNLQILEKDLQTLTKHHVLVSDIQPANYIYNQIDETMHIIDPGRYSVEQHTSINYEKQNLDQLNTLINSLIYNDLISYKPIQGKAKLQKLRDYIITHKKDEYYSDYFKRELKNFESPHLYFKSLERYLH